jgi:hypothetical protein
MGPKRQEDFKHPRLLVESAGNSMWMPSGLALAYGSVMEGGQNQISIIDLATRTWAA